MKPLQPSIVKDGHSTTPDLVCFEQVQRVFEPVSCLCPSNSGFARFVMVFDHLTQGFLNVRCDAFSVNWLFLATCAAYVALFPSINRPDHI